jgi:DnaJ family protein C protein 11
VGFYDCFMGGDKSLRIQYRFRGKVHDVTVADEDPVKCPMRGVCVTQRWPRMYAT